MSGLMQSGILSGVALGAVALPGSYPHYLSMVQALGIGPVLIFSTKFVLAFPIVYHFWNGFRHLAWDMGHGFKIAELYKVQIFSLSFPFISFEILRMIFSLATLWWVCQSCAPWACALSRPRPSFLQYSVSQQSGQCKSSLKTEVFQQLRRLDQRGIITFVGIA